MFRNLNKNIKLNGKYVVNYNYSVKNLSGERVIFRFHLDKFVSLFPNASPSFATANDKSF